MEVKSDLSLLSNYRYFFIFTGVFYFVHGIRGIMVIGTGSIAHYLYLGVLIAGILMATAGFMQEEYEKSLGKVLFSYLSSLLAFGSVAFLLYEVGGV